MGGKPGSLFTVFMGRVFYIVGNLRIWGLGCSLSQILNVCCLPLEKRADDRGHRGDVLSSRVPGSETTHLSRLLRITAALKSQQLRCGVKSHAGVSASLYAPIGVCSQAGYRVEGVFFFPLY